MVKERGWQIGNIDSVVIAEQPQLKPYLQAMRARLASTLQLELDTVSIKATTNEKLGSIGREEGIGVHAVVLLMTSAN